MKKTRAQQMAALRADKEARGECRQCENPVAINPKTGQPRKCCEAHLRQDARRNARKRRT